MNKDILRTAARLLVAFAALCVTAESAAEPPPVIEEMAQLQQVGWRLPRPPYPAQARIINVQGVVYVRMTTNAQGKIAKIVVLEEPKSVESGILRENTLSYASHNWSGPPNSIAATKVNYFLH